MATSKRTNKAASISTPTKNTRNRRSVKLTGTEFDRANITQRDAATSTTVGLALCCYEEHSSEAERVIEAATDMMFSPQFWLLTSDFKDKPAEHHFNLRLLCAQMFRAGVLAERAASISKA